MIEKIIIDYLKNKLSVPVLAEIPSNPPDEFVVVNKTSGSKANCIYSSSVAIRSRSTSKFKACWLDEEVQNAMLGNGIDDYGITIQPEISRCELNTSADLTDTANKKYQYQSLFDIIHY